MPTDKRTLTPYRRRLLWQAPFSKAETGPLFRKQINECCRFGWLVQEGQSYVLTEEGKRQRDLPEPQPRTFIDPAGPALCCNQCGLRFPLRLPEAVRTVAALNKAWVLLHKYCQAPGAAGS